MNIEKMREEFEAFHRNHLEEMGMDESDIASEFDRKDDGEYLFSMAADAWPYWKASRAAMSIELPVFDDYPASIDAEMRESLRDAIEAAGLKVKP